MRIFRHLFSPKVALGDRSGFSETGTIATSPLATLGIASGPPTPSAFSAAHLVAVPFVHLDEWDQFPSDLVVPKLWQVARERQVRVLYVSRDMGAWGAQSVREVPIDAADTDNVLREYLAEDQSPLGNDSFLFLEDLSLLFLAAADDYGLVAGSPDIVATFGPTDRTVELFGQSPEWDVPEVLTRFWESLR